MGKLEYRDGGYSVVIENGYATVSAGGKEQKVQLTENSYFGDVPEPVLKKLSSAGVTKNTHKWLSGLLVRAGASEVIQKAIDRIENDSKEKETQKIKAITGLSELKNARDAMVSNEDAAESSFRRMMEDGNNDGARPPKQIDKSLREKFQTLQNKYPIAATYLKAEAFTQSSNHHKFSAGEKAKKMLESGSSIEEAEEVLKNWLPESAIWN